ncbi:hypothetical protein RBG61_03295 [Paludicola sp. MB14-C6]|uniref:hypothetical protein n=1 Tax=Paludihabitans sp. MB14-C6 TaxID=3070656 RepID=UPI0027DB1DE5|nr:hypothetical protein [Paludicola sp. MB14-C6]WMJ23706.1 hypothetical protein RBG61_03295 [Paludicola sp. MB14-C6]
MSRQTCPRCGSRNTAIIIWGEPVFSKELEQQLNNNEVVLGGCCITEVDPTHHCNQCKKDFGVPTTILEMKTNEINFNVGGFFNGYSSLSGIKDLEVATLTYMPPFHKNEEEKLKLNITGEEWSTFVHDIYSCYVADWENRYDNELILDGVQWSLDIKYFDGNSLKIYGSNMFSPYWDKLMVVYKKYLKKYFHIQA